MNGVGGVRWLAMATVLLGLAQAAAADSRTLQEIRDGKRVGEAAAADEAGAAAGDGAAGNKAKVPAGWLRGVGPSGYDRALELQKASGLDLLVLFYRETPKDEKGLLSWFEKKGMNESHVLKLMRRYVKVRIDAAQNDKGTRALIDEYHVGKTPRLVVRRPDGFTTRVDVFEWPGGSPELVPPRELVENLKAASSPAYQKDEADASEEAEEKPASRLQKPVAP